MVVVRKDILDAAMDQQGLTARDLIARMGMSEGIVYRLMSGGSVGPKAQDALYKALGGAVPVEELFSVTLRNGEAA